MRPFTVFVTFACMGCGVVLGLTAFLLVSYWRAADERLLLTVVRGVADYYVEDVPQEQLVDNAIRGVLAGLDDHSVLLDRQALLALEEDTKGRFGGIGVELGVVDGHVTVVGLLDDEPAAIAGIAAGDRVIEVDHQSLDGRTLRQAVEELRGRPGTEVHVRIRRKDNDELLDFDITRDAIETASARGRLLTPGYGYIHVRYFNDTTTGDLLVAVEELEADGPLQGLVVDLRDNPGGLLETAVEVADAFLDEGLIVYTEARVEDAQLRIEAEAGDLIDGAPLVVLINGRSASAAEIVAAALQDQSRATVIGTTSYGKGSVQSVLYFQERRAIKLTTARYYTPAGTSIHDSGVTPDIAVGQADGEDHAAYDERLLAEALAVLQDRSS